jgi:hypothetical protein
VHIDPQKPLIGLVDVLVLQKICLLLAFHAQPRSPRVDRSGLWAGDLQSPGRGRAIDDLYEHWSITSLLQSRSDWSALNADSFLRADRHNREYMWVHGALH